MIVVFMAAGQGSRYGKLKQFDTIGPNGEWLMEFSIFDAIATGCTTIVIVTSEKYKESTYSYLKQRIPVTVQLHVVAQQLTDVPVGCTPPKERTKPWGTAHAVWAARAYLTETFIVLNADDYYGKEVFTLARSFVQNASDTAFGLVAYPLKKTISAFGSVSRGICEVEKNTLKSITERTKLVQKKAVIIDEIDGTPVNGNSLVSMNFWICQPLLISAITQALDFFLSNEEKAKTQELYLPVIIQHLLNKKEVECTVIPTKNEWFGITYAEDRFNSQQALAKLTTNALYPSPLWKTA